MSMQRPLQLVFRDMDKSPHLENAIRARVTRLDHFHANIIGCRVVVEVPHRSAAGAKPELALSVEVEIAGRPLIVARDSETRRDAKNDQLAVVTHVFQAVERQLAGNADIIRNREVKASAAAGETGMIVRLFPDQGYGFVEVRGAPDLYFTRQAVGGNKFDRLQVGTMVYLTRATAEGPMGPQASSIDLLDGSSVPA
jgi:cold shock CspA family protein/ribosome-associated translation inhibitor RaiA